MKNSKFISVIKIGILAAFILNINFVSSQKHLSYANVFKHSVNAKNTRGHVTSLENGSLNNHKDLLLYITHDYGTSGPYVTQPLGVWFNGSAWTIFSQDRSPMKTGAKFNVLGVNKSDDAYVHTASNKTNSFFGISTSNIRGSATRLNHPTLNNNPSATFIITQNWGSKGPYNTSHTGVRYADGFWLIYNLDGSEMPEGAKFNILISPTDLRHEVSNASRKNHITYLNEVTMPVKNKTMIFATFNSRNSIKNFNNGIGVWYSKKGWAIYNENKAPMKGNEAYNILLF